MEMATFNVLFIDSYDSFTYNVVRLIEKQEVKGFEEVRVSTIHNDRFKHVDELQEYLAAFDCVVVGPGPGNPVNGVADVGVIDSLFSDKLKEVPILGICLGFQALCFSQGSKIDQLTTIKHGQVYDVRLTQDGKDDGIYKNHSETFKSTRYHSLHIREMSKNVVPLSYTSDENGQILMAAKIKKRPWYGVQYHPESCCSQLGDELIKNFLRIANTSNLTTERYLEKLDLIRNNEPLYQEKLRKLESSIDRAPIYNINESYINNNEIDIKCFDIPKSPKLLFSLCDKIDQSKFVMASSKIDTKRGEWSIICLPDEQSTVFTHYDQLRKTTCHKWKDPSLTRKSIEAALYSTSSVTFSESLKVINENKDKFWSTIGNFMKPNLIANHSEIPFIGGLVGILGYEMGYFVNNSIDPNEKLQPDAKLVFINNTIAIDHINGKLYTISLNETFPETVAKHVELLKSAVHESDYEVDWANELPKNVTFDIQMPLKKDYAKAFNKCQEYMHLGDSYEICLTTQTRITPSERIEPWRIFQTLVQKNPAPFSSYFKFDDTIDESNDKVLCFVSTSPERFIKWNDNACELRPIKGTVKKGPEMTFEKAASILKTPKEFGENLMILDLIRNDLFELLRNVTVEEFMSVEEYKSVYQLVSVIKGEGLKEKLISKDALGYSGLDVFRHSLPAGSMTGAPKKITVELLQNELESELNKHVSGGVRGVYSGVTGYWSVNDNADWSVNIRCMYSYDNGNNWQIGAGGAITVLSTLEGELEEMYTKLESALQVFQ